VGEAAHRAFFGGIASLFAELDFRAEHSFHRGDAAAVYFRARCVAHEGQAVEADGIDLFEFDPLGKIRRLAGYWDPATLLAAASRASGEGPRA
jgi:ketosteroid isomerase-like protein